MDPSTSTKTVPVTGESRTSESLTSEPLARLLALVAELGNVSEACRRLGVDRSVYYRGRRSLHLRDAEKAGRSAPLHRGKASALQGRMVELSLQNPEWGCDRIAWYLTLTGSPVSSPTVQKYLIRHGLGRKKERLARRAAGPHDAGSVNGT